MACVCAVGGRSEQRNVCLGCCALRGSRSEPSRDRSPSTVRRRRKVTSPKSGRSDVLCVICYRNEADRGKMHFSRPISGFLPRLTPFGFAGVVSPSRLGLRVSRLSTRRVVVSACRAFVSPVSRLQVIRSDDLAPGRRALEQTKRNHLRTDGFTVNSAPALCTLQVQLSVQARRLSRLRLPPRTPRVRPLALPVSGTRVARRDVALTVAAYDARTATGRTVHPCTRSSQTATISAAYFLIL